MNFGPFLISSPGRLEAYKEGKVHPEFYTTAYSGRDEKEVREKVLSALLHHCGGEVAQTFDLGPVRQPNRRVLP